MTNGGIAVISMVVVGALWFSGCADQNATVASDEVKITVAPDQTGSDVDPELVEEHQGESPSANASINGPLQDAFMGGTDFVTGEAAQERAFNTYLEKCMAKEGYLYVAPAPNLTEIRFTRLELAYGTALADSAYRETQGYGATGWLVGLNTESDSPLSDDNTKGMSSAEMEAYQNASDDCGALAHKNALPGDLLDQVAMLSSDIATRIMNDPEILSAISDWASCMNGEGYQVTSMDDPVNQLESRSRSVAVGSAQAKALHKDELAQASTDWACRVSSYNDVYFRVRDRIQTQFIDDNSELVAQLRDTVKELVYG